MIHDCIYQFLRLFYHSRFKPQQLEMTWSQLSAPALDLILVVPLILRLLKDFSRFSNETKMRLQSKPGIIGNEPRRFFETFDLKSIRKSQNEVPFILTYIFILDGMFATAWWKSKTRYFVSSQKLSKDSSFWDESQGSSIFLHWSYVKYHKVC